MRKRLWLGRKDAGIFAHGHRIFRETHLSKASSLTSVQPLVQGMMPFSQNSGRHCNTAVSISRGGSQIHPAQRIWSQLWLLSVGMPRPSWRFGFTAAHLRHGWTVLRRFGRVWPSAQVMHYSISHRFQGSLQKGIFARTWRKKIPLFSSAVHLTLTLRQESRDVDVLIGWSQQQFINAKSQYDS